VQYVRPARLLLALFAFTTCVVGFTSYAAETQIQTQSAGEALYRNGLLPSGQPMRGERADGEPVQGSAAACVNCHRRSGLGTTGGRIVIPAITGKYLFQPGARPMPESGAAALAVASARDRYTDATLARAISKGIGPDGHELSYLMPRFKLDAASMGTLIDYLRGLSTGPVPGVSGDTLHFATVITPDADPTRRQGMLAVLRAFFASKNEFFRGDAPALYAQRKIMFRVVRKWQLHVWELTGPADTWDPQLQEKLRAEPVFALVSGLAGADWSPVHRFCQREAIPCLLPNVDAPVVDENAFYPVYFSKGVLLEAQLVAQQLTASAVRPQIKRLIQVFRTGDAGEAAAQALRDALPAGAPETESRAVNGASGRQGLTEALRGITEHDALMLWLRPDDLQGLPSEPPTARLVFVSGLMGQLENAPLLPAWRRVAQMAYPFDLPELRRVRMNYPLGWFAIRHIPLVAERTQVDTYLACVILAEALGHMRDDFVRDYLVEQLETMVSFRLINGYYPRLGLAPGQRFASKGGYIVHFADPQGNRIIADGDWIAP